MGIGGGIIMVPATVYFLSMDQHKSQGTSLLAIIPIALVGALIYAHNGNINWHYVFWIALGGLIGANAGSFFALRFSEKTLKTIYAVFLIFVGIKMVIG